MRSRELHLLEFIPPSIGDAVEAAYRWALVEYPQADPALIANFAERLATKMAENTESQGSERRYAYAAMNRKIREWYRSKAVREVAVGLDQELDQRADANDSFQKTIDRSILFQQLEAQLNKRDRYILVLMLERQAGPFEIANALGVSYAAAAKAIQRVRERIAVCMDVAKTKGDRSRKISTAKGLTKEWI